MSAKVRAGIFRQLTDVEDKEVVQIVCNGFMFTAKLEFASVSSGHLVY